MTFIDVLLAIFCIPRRKNRSTNATQVNNPKLNPSAPAIEESTSRDVPQKKINCTLSAKEIVCTSSAELISSETSEPDLCVNTNNNHKNNTRNFYRDYYSGEPILNVDNVFSVNEWHDYSSEYIYHYTTIHNAKEILRDKVINANWPKRHNYGKGVFFTILPPNRNDRDLIVNNYIYLSHKYFSNVECAFAFKKSDLNLKRINADCGRDVWCFNGDINLVGIQFRLVVRKNKHTFDSYLVTNVYS